MKTRKKVFTKTAFIILKVIFVSIVLFIGVWFETGNTIIINASTSPYNDANSTDGVRIDGWREFQGMTTYGRNTDYGCGFTAMAILLQYYNDYTMLSGDILPSNFDYNLDTGTLGSNTRANALRQDLKNRTPRLLGSLGQDIVQWFTNINAENATAAVNHKDGLNSFFQANNLNLSASHFDWHNAGSNSMVIHLTYRTLEQIDANKPVIMTILSYKYTGATSGSGTFFGGDAHVVVVYGYRFQNNEIQFLAHSGWDNDTELWFSPYGIMNPFIYGITYIDEPVLPRYNTTPIENDSIQIDSVNGALYGQVTIPSIFNGRTVTQIGNSAFANQTQLSQISIPSSVTSIGSNAFEDCSNLEKVVIQREIGDITSLGSNAFLGCSSLETIEVPTKRILDYLYATNWSNYSSFMHYIDPITDGLTIVSVGGISQYYLFQVDESTIEETTTYNFYHHCDNPIEITIYDDENSVVLTNPTWNGDLIFIELEEGELYKLVIETTNSEYFNIHIDKIIETELELGVKYYETLNSYSYAYYRFTTPNAQDDIPYTVNSIISGARTNMWLYNGYDNLITYAFGDINRNGAKIDYYLEPDTTYTVLLYLTSYYYYDDYTIQFYETDEEVYHLDWGGISKQYFDPLTYDYASFIVFSYCYDLVFDETTKTITFGMIECFWDVTFDGYPNCPEEYVIGMMIGITYDSFENTLAFFSMNGFYEYQAPLPYTYSYSATVTDISITFSSAEWASYVTQGPR